MLPASAIVYPSFGGEGGIRTHGGLAPTAVFKTAALNHSATSPARGLGPASAPSRPHRPCRASRAASRVSGWPRLWHHRFEKVEVVVRIALRLSGFAALFAAPSADAPPAWGHTSEGFQSDLPRLRSEALAAGVSRRTIDTIFPALEYSARTVERDRAQPGGAAGSSAIPAFAPYRAR